MSRVVDTRPGDGLVLEPEARRLLFTEARTANTFANEPVSDGQLRAITELAKWPPTMANINPLRILFLRTQDGKDRVGRLMADNNREKTLSAPVVAVLSVDIDFHERLPQLLPFKPELRAVFAADRENREQLATFNGALQAGYFILAVRAAGLAAGPMLGYDSAGVDREFFPDGTHKTILIVNIGKPGDRPWLDRLPRLAHEDYVTYA
jgi:3-hydroxypropanoate dehydrogenase